MQPGGHGLLAENSGGQVLPILSLPSQLPKEGREATPDNVVEIVMETTFQDVGEIVVVASPWDVDELPQDVPEEDETTVQPSGQGLLAENSRGQVFPVLSVPSQLPENVGDATPEDSLLPC